MLQQHERRAELTGLASVRVLEYRGIPLTPRLWVGKALGGTGVKPRMREP